MGWIGRMIGRELATGFACVAMLGISAASEVSAQQQDAAATQQGASAASAPNNGEDFTRPENLFQLRYQYLTAPGSGGANGITREVTTNTLYLRSDIKYDLGSKWEVVFRGDLPLIAKDPIAANIPGAAISMAWATPTFRRR